MLYAIIKHMGLIRKLNSILYCYEFLIFALFRTDKGSITCLSGVVSDVGTMNPENFKKYLQVEYII